MTDETGVAEEAPAQVNPEADHSEPERGPAVAWPDPDAPLPADGRESSANQPDAVLEEADQLGSEGAAGSEVEGESAASYQETEDGQEESVEARTESAPEEGGDRDGEPADEGEGQTEIEVAAEEVIDDLTMRRAVEAILMVTDEPLAAVTLARAVGRATVDVAETLTSLAEEYAEQGRGFELREVAGGWRYYTREDAAPYVERFVLDGQQARLTQAALETLAVIAYKQPVSRARVSAIRGVNVDGVVRTLVTRGLVEEAGMDTESQATLYRTTSYFLERMGMQSLEDLPELAPYLPDMDDIEDELTPQAAPAEADPDTEAVPGPEAVSDAGPATDAGPGTDAEPGIDAGAGADAQGVPDGGPWADAEAETDPEAATDAGPEADAAVERGDVRVGADGGEESARSDE